MLYRIIAASPQAFSFQLSASGFRHPSRASGKIVASPAGACSRGPLYSRSVSVTGSIRRVRTRTHGGVAGAGGWPPPLCRSINLTAPGGAVIGTDEKALRVAATRHGAAISPAGTRFPAGPAGWKALPRGDPARIGCPTNATVIS
jgi:hypothetical protein